MPSSYERLVISMLENPPDPNEPLPPANRRETILGITIPFLVLACIAVIFRLHVRIRVVREPGWDDAVVVLAAIMNLIATTFVFMAVYHGGLGHHMLYLPIPTSKNYLRYFYLAHALYITQTAVIKISLLLQFLRIFKAGYMRMICLGLLGIVSVWGLGFSIVGWFPCFPVRGYWERTINARCYGFGFGDSVEEFVDIYKAHSASNMVLDIAIFLTPLVLFGRPNLSYRSLLSMVGIFALGGICVGTSIWRLHSIIHTRAGTYPTYDFTWYTPVIIILACLEIDLAIMCASVPIFWPMFQKSLATIFVQYEVDIREERIGDEYGLAYELEHSKNRRTGSFKSMSGTSVEELTKGDSRDNTQPPKFSVGVDPLSAEVSHGYRTSVHAKPKQKWAI